MNEEDRTFAQQHILIVGIGNEYRSDDAIGLHIARRLRERDLENVTVREISSNLAGLLDLWEGFEKVIVVDAMSSSAPPGIVHRFSAHAEPMPSACFRVSSHAFGVAEAIELARTLHLLPKEVIVYGVEGRRYETGTEISPEVLIAANRLVKQISSEILAEVGSETVEAA